ncbi:MAG: GspH/FimT family pseudopilin [Burkholderiaceae bacterium]|nr:GspH/FimT family pseudopilin [Burkholderiaceae bacterium]
MVHLPRRRFSSFGFTLIELMVTLALLAILSAIAVPSLVTFRRNAELTGITNNFLAALHTARSESMKRNMNAMVVPTNKDTDWSKGWIVFVDVDRSATYSTGDIVVMEQEAPPSYITVSGNSFFAASPSYVMYDGSGFSKVKTGSGDLANGTLTISRNDAASTDYSQIRRIKIAITGSVRICTPKSASDTACSATGD